MKHEEKAVDYKTMHVSSSEFNAGVLIPVKYTYNGVNISPLMYAIGIIKKSTQIHSKLQTI